VNDLVEKLSATVRGANYDALDDLWLELLEADEIPADALAGVLGQLRAAGQGARALDLVLALVPELVGAGRCGEALPLLRAVAPAAEGNEEVRNGLIDCYRALHRDLPHVAACIDHSGLLTDADLADAVATLERLLSYREGDYFYHASGWGLGRIVGFSPLTTVATLDFEKKPGHAVPLETIESIFTRLDPDDFRVLRRTDPERLRQLAEDDPATLVRRVLAANDSRITARSLRQALTGEIVPADSWSKWWTSARTALKRDPLVAITAGSNPVLTLRADALSYEEEMRVRFEALIDLRHQTELVREYTEHRAKEADPQAFLLPAARAIAARIRDESNPGHAFEAALLITRLRVDAGDFPSPEEIVRQQADPIPLLRSLATTAARAQAVKILRDGADDWHAVCYRMLRDGPRELWETAAGELPGTGEPHSIQSLVHDVLDEPERRLELFAWVSRTLLLGRWHVDVTPTQVFEQLLTEANALSRQKTYQRGGAARFSQDEVLAMIRQALRAGEFSYFDRILESSSETEAARLLFRIRQSSGPGPLAARAFEQKIVRRHPKLHAAEEGEAAGPDFIYATPEAIERRRRGLEHLLHVEIPKNSEDISRAAAMGDISDNADWRAAIQEQQVLNAKASQMTNELHRARPIEPSMVSTDHVSIGSRVTVENVEGGERSSYMILGPWDSDAEHGIIAYLSPLAQAILRHRVGEEATFSHAGETITYRVVAIESMFKR